MNRERAILVTVRYGAAMLCGVLLNWGIVIHPLHPLAAEIFAAAVKSTEELG